MSHGVCGGNPGSGGLAAGTGSGAGAEAAAGAGAGTGAEAGAGAGAASGELGLGGGGKMTVKWQRGVLRYNCADSLDRTNLASYFAAIQVLAEQCRLLGIPIETGGGAGAGAGTGAGAGGGGGAGAAGAGGGGAGLGSPAASAAATYGRREASGSSPPPPALPAGWEGRLDTVTGRTFYIDHNTRTTSWSLPGVPPPQLAAPQPAAAAVVAAGSEFVAGAERNGWAGVAGGGEGGGVGWGKSDRVGGVSNSSLSRSNSSGAGIGKTGAPFRLLQLGVDEVRGKIIPGVLNAMMEVFLANGDLHAAVYTASRAIHTVGGHHSSTSKLAVSGLHRIR